MDSFAAPVITQIVESLRVRFMRKLGFFVSYSKYVRDMNTKVRDLKRTACDMDDKQKLNNANSLVVPRHVPEWLAKVEEIGVRADRIPTGGVGCCNIKMRYKVGKQCYDILKAIDQLMKEKSEIVWTDKKISLAMVSTPWPSAVYDDNQNENRIESRELIFSEALKSLEPNNSKTQKMALCGMPGVGKTTMMEQLKRVAKDRKMFDWIVKVDIGQNPNLLVVQQAVAEYLGEPLTETTKDTRAVRLENRFEKMSNGGRKKILVILDDVWEELNLKDIGLSSPFPSGFKLLLISRDENICSLMGVETSLIFTIDVLKDQEAKSLFWETTGLGSDSDNKRDVHHIGEDIVKKCGGLPIAIKTIACTLRDNSKDAWADALFRLHNKEFRVHDDIFEISYNNLKDDYEKATFLLSGLFPEDYNIAIEDLLMYGWGLKLFKNVHTIAKARSRVNTCVSKLIRSNLLIKSDREGCVKMHDLVRDFVLTNFSEVKQASISDHDNNVLEQLKEEESYARILLKCGGLIEFPVDFNYPNLVLLKLMEGDKLLKFPEEFYTRMEKLEVVAYENMHRPLLPQHSTNLRALFLHSCLLMDDDVSFLGDLINLEALSLANCGIHKLPSKIGKLKKLKLLDLTGCVNLCIDDGVFQNMDKLEELYMSVSQKFNGNGTSIRFTDANCDELKMLSRKLSALELEFFENKAQPKYVYFDKLERFRISLGCLLEKKRFWKDDEYSFKNTLKLHVTSFTDILECKINELFRNTEILYLEVSDMNHLEDVSVHPPQHSFSNLKVLHVCGSVHLACLFTIPMAKGLRKLESLVIRSCPVLKDIWSCEITSSEDEVNNISKLRKIEVKDCNSLVNLFPSNSMRLLSHLEELTVEKCGSIRVLFNIKQGENEQLSSSLRRIKVRELVKLREVWRINDAENNYFCFKAMESIVISSCERFRNIFTPTTANFDMRALIDIRIYSCGEYGERKNEIITTSKEEISKVNHMSVPSFLTHNCHHVRKISFAGVKGLEVVFDMDSPSISELATTQEQEQAPPLLPYLEDICLRWMETLGNVWKCSSWNKFFIVDKQPQSSFQNLTTIKLEDCKRIKYLFSPLMAKFLSNLKEVEIISCNRMKELVSNRDDTEDEEVTSTSAHVTTTFFPHLQLLSLSNMYKLKHIDGGVAKGTTNGQSKGSQVDIVSWSLSQYSREIRIYGCRALSSVIPSYTAGRMQKLETLSIHDCSSLIEVFDTEEIINNSISGCSSSTAVAIPRPTNSTMHELPNLKELVIRECKHLEYIFTFSTLESLKKLETLMITDCKAMKVIVREEYEEQSLASSSKDMSVVFPHLKSIKLSGLPNLAGFSMAMNIDFQWPSLDYVMMKDCPQMMVFTCGRSTAPRLKSYTQSLANMILNVALTFK